MFYTRAMTLILARVVLVLLLLSFAGSRAQDTDLLENPIWTADGQAAVTLILEYARGFDPAFRNAYMTPLDRETTEIVIRSALLTDSDGNLYRLSVLVTARDGTVVLTFLNLEGDLPDLNAPLLSSRLLKGILQLMDTKFKRVPQT